MEMQPYFEFKYIKTQWNSVCGGKVVGEMENSSMGELGLYLKWK